MNFVAKRLRKMILSDELEKVLEKSIEIPKNRIISLQYHLMVRFYKKNSQLDHEDANEISVQVYCNHNY